MAQWHSARGRRWSGPGRSSADGTRPAAHPGAARSAPHRSGPRPGAPRRWRRLNTGCYRSGPDRSWRRRPGWRGSRRTARHRAPGPGARLRRPARWSPPAARVRVGLGVGDAPVQQPGVQLVIALHPKPWGEEAFPHHADLVLHLTLLPSGRGRAGDWIDEVVAAHLQEAAIIGPLLAPGVPIAPARWGWPTKIASTAVFMLS